MSALKVPARLAKGVSIPEGDLHWADNFGLADPEPMLILLVSPHTGCPYGQLHPAKACPRCDTLREHALKYMSAILDKPSWIISFIPNGLHGPMKGVDSSGATWTCETVFGHQRFWFSQTSGRVRCACGCEVFRLTTPEEYTLHGTCVSCGHSEAVASD